MVTKKLLPLVAKQKNHGNRYVNCIADQMDLQMAMTA
jgi:hypothetical protein